MKKTVSYLCILLLLFGLIGGCANGGTKTSPDLIPDVSPNVSPDVSPGDSSDIINKPDDRNTPEVNDSDVTDNANGAESPDVSPA